MKVIGDGTEMMPTFDSKLWVLSHLLFLAEVVEKIFSLIFYVTIYNGNKVNPAGE